MAMAMMQFEPMHLRVDVTFWNELAKRKLDEIRLNDAPLAISGRYSAGSTTLDLDYTAFTSTTTSSSTTAAVPGSRLNAVGRLVLVNTAGDFRALDKKALLAQFAQDVWSEYRHLTAPTQAVAACRFLLIAYADLKRHDYTFVSAVLALRLSSGDFSVASTDAVSTVASDSERSAAVQALASAGPEAGWAQVDSRTVAVWDAVPADATHAGWPLRNVLAIAVALGLGPDITALCVRDDSHVRAVHVHLPAMSEGVTGVGWTAPKPKTVSLASALDPRRLAETAVDLNVKLMRWRMLPELQADHVAATKCLLLGAGTLGCAVARGLLGWGVRHVTFVDNARVSYSNPVRQTLFTFEDCANGGRWKAEAAADRLRQVFPGVQTSGHVLTIPMPGHHVAADDEPRVREAVAMLERLVVEHDAVFLLGDSRECRWLPTLLAAVHRKLVINVGLGFDSYVVMRHGIAAATTADCQQQLGCYFCSDVVAPRDSVSDRTLDQACTVTRPGVSMVAAALACELLVSVLHHPHGAMAPADGTCALGGVPHQLRGFLSQWSTLQLSGVAYDKCTACSAIVTGEYRRRGFAFLLDAFNTPTFLEDLTGLTALRKEELARQQREAATAANADQWQAIGGDKDDF